MTTPVPAPAPALVHVSVEVPGTAEHLGELHAALQRFWGEVERALPAPPEEEWRLVFATALGEAAANVVRHAYQNGALPGAMRADLLAFPDRIEARFTDWGLEFEGDLQAPVAPPADPLEELPESGYGLSLIRAAVDELRYERTEATPRAENRWRLLKRLPPALTPRA